MTTKWNEEAYDAYAKRMEETYPEMYGKQSEDDYGYGGFAIGAGWWPIVEALSAQIQSRIKWKNKTSKIVKPVRVRQVKEKFGGLRFYYDGGDEHISGMVRMAESWAALTCEKCGTPGKLRSNLRSGGWMQTLCDHHEAEREAQMKERFIE